MTFPDAAAPLRAEIETALDLVPLLISAGDLRRINIGLRAGAAALADDGLAPSIRLFQGMVSAHHHMLHESLQAVLGNRVAHGLFAGMELAPGMVGSASLPRLIGSYEDELQPLLAAIVPSHARVVDIGAAEGWYVVGLARRFGVPVLGFDIEAIAREMTLRNARTNGVAELVAVEGECAPARLRALAEPGTLFIIDIEGAEAALFAAVEPTDLAAADFVIETHGRSALALVDRFATTHDVTLIWPSGRSIASYPVLRRLSEIDRAVALWEGRGNEPWIHCASRHER